MLYQAVAVLKRVLIVSLLGVLVTPVFASVDRRTMIQRQVFQDAELALKRGQMKKYRALEKTLRDYPLHPYLKFREIRRNLSSSNYKSIHRFLQDHPGTPLAVRLHYSWLKSLASKRQWKTLIDNFYYTSDKGLQCDFARALLMRKRPKRAYAVLEGLWMTGRALPERCNYPIERWKKSGKLTQRLIWERIRLAMQSRRSNLALEISDYLDKQDQYWVRIWAKVRRDPNYVLKIYKRFKGSDLQPLRWVLADGLGRMARKDPPLAAQLWFEWRDKYKFSKRDKDRLERRLTLELVKDDAFSANSWIMQLKLTKIDKRVHEYYIINTIQDQDWQAALDWMDRLKTKERHSEQWRYWRARCLEALGRVDEARTVYLLNANNRSYYGFLSADRAEINYKFAHRPVKYSAKALSDIEKFPAIERARELYALKRIPHARREWNYAITHLTKPQLLIAAQLAHQWDWHDRTIITFARAKYWDDLEKRFPLAHQDLVINYSRKTKINPAWAFAIIRQESAFIQDAKSHAGAMGLMQLMPKTAQQMARALSIKIRRSDLLIARTNVKLGINYLKYVKDKFKGNSVLATAAYNAGGHRVNRWLPKEGNLSADIWVEKVPFNETRNYLKRVLTYTIIYEQRLGKRPTSLQERMLPVHSLKPRTVAVKVNKANPKGGV